MATDTTLQEHVGAELYDTVYKCMTQSGVIMADTSSIKSEIEAVFKYVFGENVDLTAETPLGRLVEMWTLTLAQFSRITAQNANQTNLNYSSGIYLDAVASLFRLKRKAATRTRIPVILTGVKDAVVPAGAAMTSVGGVGFTLESDVTIGEDGKASGIAVADEPGAVTVAVNELNRMDSSIVGWYGVNNPHYDPNYSVGGLVESDADFRNRIAASRHTGSGFISSIKHAVDSVDGVTDSVIVENDTGVVQEVDGIEMSPHSVFVCVDGGDSQSVAEAIFAGKSAGCAYTRIGSGNVNSPYPYEAHPDGSAEGSGMTVYDVCGLTHKVYFYRPEPVSLAVQVRVNLTKYTGSDYIADVRNAVSAWAEGRIESVQRPRIGIDVYASDIALAISTLFPLIWVRSVGVKEGGSAISSGSYRQDMFIAGSQRATVTPSEIHVLAVS